MPRTRLNHLDALSRLASLSPGSLSPVLFIWALYFYLFIWLLFFLLFTNFVCSKFSYYWIVFVLFCFSFHVVHGCMRPKDYFRSGHIELLSRRSFITIT